MQYAERPGAAAPSWWGFYFGATQVQDRHKDLIKELVTFLRTQAGRHQLQSVDVLPDGKTVMAVDYEALYEASQIGDLGEALFHVPNEGLACLTAAVHQAMHNNSRSTHPIAATRVNVRLTNFTKSCMAIRDLQANSIGKLATIKGTVVRCGQIRQLNTRMDFTCAKCHGCTTADFEDGKFAYPAKCAEDGCRGRSFTPVQGSVQCRDWQRIRLQEEVGAEQGRVPKTLEVELVDDLVGGCSVGDVVTVLGMVKVIAAKEETGSGKGQGKGQCLYLIYLEAISLINHSTAPSEDGQYEGEEGGRGAALQAGPVNFSMKDLDFIIAFSEQSAGRQLALLVQSLCPAIYGYEMVKAGIVLAMFGGASKNTNNPNVLPVRSDIHVLIVGDPGMGKSQMLKAAASAAPRAFYVCGKSASGAGLTVSVVKDPISNDFVFDAGAMVLGDRGICCVDEFDKMSGEHQTLLEAMEQQEISVAKAGLVARLPARTTVIAAANPVEGHYNRGKTAAENLRMSPAMLSRFDLTFILMDRPDPTLDVCMSEHVMALHSGAPDRASTASRLLQDRRPGTAGSMGSQSSLPARSSSGSGLLQRLSATLSDTEPLPHQLFRKYVAYARQHAQPSLSPEAGEVLQKFYLQLTAQATPGDSTPSTARQLESLIRLAEARARVDLREVVTRQDALDVVDIMREAMFDRVLGDEVPFIDFRKKPGSRGGKAAEAERFLESLKRKAAQAGSNIFTMAQLRSHAATIQLKGDADKLIFLLNEQGDLLQNGPGEYRVGRLASSSTQASQMSAT